MSDGIGTIIAALASVIASFGTAAFVFASNPRNEKVKAEVALALESRRRIYLEVQPLFFQLFDAAELGFAALPSFTEALEVTVPPPKQRGRVLQANDPVSAAQEILAFLDERHAL